MQFLRVLLLKSTMYPVEHDMQLKDEKLQPLQLTEQFRHLFVTESAYVPNGQLVDCTQVFVVGLRKVEFGQDKQVNGSFRQVLHPEWHSMQIFPESE